MALARKCAGLKISTDARNDEPLTRSERSVGRKMVDSRKGREAVRGAHALVTVALSQTPQGVTRSHHYGR
jgi:hypothetical protein